MEVRPLVEDDLPFLQQMLYAALFWRPDDERLPFDFVIAHPAASIFHAGWGREGDTGFVAVDESSPIGCVWYRFFTETEHGEGFVDESTPEIAIAVIESRRGQGVGRALMNAAHDHARRAGTKQISLSVNADNPAKRLYASMGYVDVARDDPTERMILRLD